MLFSLVRFLKSHRSTVGWILSSLVYYLQASVWRSHYLRINYLLKEKSQEKRIINRISFLFSFSFYTFNILLVLFVIAGECPQLLFLYLQTNGIACLAHLSLSCYQVDGVRKEKERLTAAH